MTNNQNGGDWKKINEYVDRGNWEATSFYNYAEPWPCPSVPLDYVINHEMPYVFVRNDGISEANYKNFSIREISPLS